MIYTLNVIEGYSRLDSEAQFLVSQNTEHYTLKRAQKALSEINAKLKQRLGRQDFMPRIDIKSSDGRVFQWGYCDAGKQQSDNQETEI